MSEGKWVRHHPRSRIDFWRPLARAFAEHARLALGLGSPSLDALRAGEASAEAFAAAIDAPGCLSVDPVGYSGTGYVCSEPAGHDGDHLAIDPATGDEVARW